VDPLHKKIKDKYNEEVEFPDIQKRIQALQDRKKYVSESQPSIDQLKQHDDKYMRRRREILQEKISKRML